MAIDLAAERWESLKAGTIGALEFTIPCIFATIINETVLQHFLQVQHVALPIGADLWMSLGAAVGCGFLFGITYRYARRTDTNPFLQQGVVLAFGLTRAAGAIAPGIHWLSWGISTAEGLIGYGIAAVGLDWALRQGWVQPPSEQSNPGN
ncbi:MAG: hypothetical protein AAFY11_06965 [Cyanobacteria bacterium J06641_5]